MEQNRSSHWKGCALRLNKGGTYELSYTISIPPCHAMEADFFLRCNTIVLDRTIRRIRKQSGYRLTVVERDTYQLEDDAELLVDAFSAEDLESLSPPICCTISAKKLL